MDEEQDPLVRARQAWKPGPGAQGDNRPWSPSGLVGAEALANSGLASVEPPVHVGAQAKKPNGQGY